MCLLVSVKPKFCVAQANISTRDLREDGYFKSYGNHWALGSYQDYPGWEQFTRMQEQFCLQYHHSPKQKGKEPKGFDSEVLCWSKHNTKQQICFKERLWYSTFKEKFHPSAQHWRRLWRWVITEEAPTCPRGHHPAAAQEADGWVDSESNKHV